IVGNGVTSRADQSHGVRPATLTPDTPGFPLTGTVEYTFYRGGDCTTGAADSPTQTVNVNAAGTVPDSNTKGPLAPGSYAFSATYTPAAGSSYKSSTASCEPFTVEGPPPPQLVTKVRDASNADVTNTSVPLGAVVHDTAT